MKITIGKLIEKDVERRKIMKITIGELIEKIDAIELVIQDLQKMDDDTADKAVDYLWDYLSMIRSEKVKI